LEQNIFFKLKTHYNKFIYLGFLLLGLFQVFSSNDLMQAASTLGIGLAFDPFNTETKWSERPTWQKSILVTHLSLVISTFVFAFII